MIRSTTNNTTARFIPSPYAWLSFICLAITLILNLTVDSQAQTAIYRLHKEASSSSGRLQLKPINPDGTALTIQTVDLKAAAAGEKIIREFDTQSGVPNQAGRIASGTAVTFNLWMRKTAAFGTIYPRAKLRLNSSSGTALCTATGTTTLTTTLAKYTLSCTTTANVTVSATDKFYVWTGVNLTASDSTNSFMSEMAIEGTVNGNYDSQVTVPLPTPPPPIQYVDDEPGRLIAVTDPNSNTATYSYDAVGNLTGINRQSSSTLSIVEFTRNGGPVGSGVTIYGTGFSATASQNTVKFNGTTATIISATATQIVATVPTGATSGTITITRSTVTATSTTAFTVGNSAGVPTITSFTPNIGAIGTAVTVTGTNYQVALFNNRVHFNRAPAVTNSATATSIGTAVPSNAGSGRIAVATTYGEATSINDFIVPRSGYPATDISFLGRMAIGETKTITIAVANKYAVILFDGLAGQRVNLDLTGNTIPATTSVSLFQPDNILLTSTGAVYNQIGFLDAQLPATGTYAIWVDRSGVNTGSLTLRLSSSPPDVVTTIVAGGSPVTITTTLPGQNARLSFAGTGGKLVSLKLTTNTTTPPVSVTLFDTIGTRLTGTRISNTSTSYFIDATTLPYTGTNTIVVDPEGARTGSLTLQLYNVVDATATIIPGGSPVSMTTTTLGQNALLTFAGTVGQQISVTLTNNTIPSSGFISLIAPNATYLAAATFDPNGDGYRTCLQLG